MSASKVMVSVSVAAVLLGVGCHADDRRCAAASVASCPIHVLDGPSAIATCDLCETDDECASGICRMYGDGYKKCALACEPLQPAPQCAPATTGCNGMGYCMCGPYSPPRDGGPFIDAPGFFDAAGGP